jgi:hypothetical protein
MEEYAGPSSQYLDARAQAMPEADGAGRSEKAVPRHAAGVPLAAPPTPVSRHIELYRYWDRKRGARAMPTRRDIDPVEIPQLLAHLAIIDCHHEGYRWRLMGSAIVEDFGRDLTGKNFGEYFAPSAFVDAMITTFDRVLLSARPVFAEGIYNTAFGTKHSASRAFFPLSNEQGVPAMIIFSRVTRFGPAIPLSREQDRLKNACGGVPALFDIESVDDLLARALAWEQRAERFSRGAA